MNRPPLRFMVRPMIGDPGGEPWSPNSLAELRRLSELKPEPVETVTSTTYPPNVKCGQGRRDSAVEPLTSHDTDPSFTPGKARRSAVLELLAAFRAKREADGLNGRGWDAHAHSEAERRLVALGEPATGWHEMDLRARLAEADPKRLETQRLRR